MIDPMYSVKDICAMFHLKDARAARKIMRDMEHIEHPVLLVTERSLRSWLARNTLPPESEVRQTIKRKGVR